MEQGSGAAHLDAGELHVTNIKVVENEIRLTGTVFSEAERQSRSDAISGLLGASSFSILPAPELCSRNLVAVTVDDENEKPKLCRAIITDTSEVPKGFVRVLLVDDCRFDVQVRLSHLYYCPKHVSAAKYPPNCQQYVLADILPVEGRYEDTETWLKWRILNKTVDAIFDKQPNGINYICLFDSKELPLALSLLVEGLAKMVKNPRIILSALTGSNIKLQAKEVSLPPPPRPAYSEWKMPLCIKEEAQVTSIEKGPWMFCLQFKRQKDQVPSMREKLKILQLSGKLQTGELNIGDAVICPNKYHGGHSRGLVTNKLPDNVYSVYYVDEGNKALIKQRDIWLLPEEMAKIPLLVHRCYLEGMPPTEEEDLSMRFEALVKDRLLMGTLVKMGKGVKTTANLFICGNSVLDLLSCSYKRAILLDDCQVDISHVNEEDGMLYLALSANAELLDELHSAVQVAAQSAATIEFPIEMQSCIAHFPDDNCWYRATILQVNNTVQVRYVDYGNVANISKESLRTITRSLVDLAPAQALPCVLNNVDLKLLKASEITNITANDSLKVKINGYKVVDDIGNVAIVELTTVSAGLSLNMGLKTQQWQQEKDTNNNVERSVGAFGIGLLLSQLRNCKEIPPAVATMPERVGSQGGLMKQVYLQQRFTHPPPSQSYQRSVRQPYHYEHRERRPYQGRIHQQEQQFSNNLHHNRYQQLYSQPDQVQNQQQRQHEDQKKDLYHLSPGQSANAQSSTDMAVHSPQLQEDNLMVRDPLKSPSHTMGHPFLKRVKPMEGSLKFCRLTFEAGPLCFYLVLEENEAHIKDITQKMGEMCKSNLTKSDTITCGSLVAIKDEDVWQRAQVTYTQGSMFKVFMIDVGKERCLQLYELKPLPDVLANLPAQAIKCSVQKSDVKILKGKPNSQLKELKDVQIVAHFIACKDHQWKVNLYSKIYLKELSILSDAHSSPLEDKDEKYENVLAPSKKIASVEACEDVQQAFPRINMAPMKVTNIPVRPIENLPTPKPCDGHAEQVDSFSPASIMDRPGPGPFTSTTHLDLATNSLSPSVIPFDDTVSSSESHSTVKDMSVSRPDGLNQDQAGTKIKKAPVGSSNEEPFDTSTTGVDNVLQHIASKSADKVINAALATHAHTQAKHDLVCQPVTSRETVCEEGKVPISQDEKGKSEHQSLLSDSRIEGMDCNGNNLRKARPYNNLASDGSIEESLLWDSRRGVPHIKNDMKSHCPDNAEANTESLIWDRYNKSTSKDYSKLEDKDQSCLPVEESLLWDSRRGTSGFKENLVDDTCNLVKTHDSNPTKDSVLWDSKHGGNQLLEGSKEIETEDQCQTEIKTNVMPDESTTKDSKLMATQVFGRLKLTLQTQLKVSVVFVSGSSVWVQLEEHLSALNELMDSLNMQMESSREELGMLQKGVQCISRYHIDGGWYRATVVETDNPKKVNVHYVDYGNTELVDVEDIFVLPEQFKTLPRQALHCRFPAEFQDWLEPHTERIEGLLGKSALISVEESSEDDVWTLVMLETEGENLVEVIKQSIPTVEVKKEIEKVQQSVRTEDEKTKRGYPPQTSMANKELVYVSYMGEESEVWLQRVEDLSLITTVSTWISEAETPLMELECVEEGLPCLAQSAVDGVWYRAKILSFGESDELIVHFIDFGNSETVSIKQVKQISEDLRSVRPLAYCCILTEHEGSVGLKALEEEFMDQELHVCILKNEAGKVFVSLLLDEKDSDAGVKKQPTHSAKIDKEPQTEKVSVENVDMTKSRKWYAPIPSSEATKLESNDVLKSPPLSEDSRTVTPNKSGSNLTGVFMSFRKMKATASPGPLSPVSTESNSASMEKRSPIASPSLTSKNSSSLTDDIKTSAVSRSTDIAAGRNTVSPVKSESGVSNLHHQVEKEIKEPGIAAVSGASKQLVDSQRRFLDCIDEAEELSEDGATEGLISFYTAYLVHIEESPFSLWVQKEEDNDLAEYIETWYKEHKQERTENLELGNICVTVLGESAQRVCIQCVEDANVTVFLIDQGKQAVVSKQDLYKLPESLTDIHPLAKQIYLPVKVASGRESGAVIAVAEVAHQRKCLCVDLDDKYTVVWCPGAENLADYLVDNKLASPLVCNVGGMRRYMAAVKRKLRKEAEGLESSDNREETSFYQTADNDLAAKLEHSLKELNAVPLPLPVD